MAVCHRAQSPSPGQNEMQLEETAFDVLNSAGPRVGLLRAYVDAPVEVASAPLVRLQAVAARHARQGRCEKGAVLARRLRQGFWPTSSNQRDSCPRNCQRDIARICIGASARIDPTQLQQHRLLRRREGPRRKHHEAGDRAAIVPTSTAVLCAGMGRATLWRLARAMRPGTRDLGQRERAGSRHLRRHDEFRSLSGQRCDAAVLDAGAAVHDDGQAGLVCDARRLPVDDAHLKPQRAGAGCNG